MRNITKIMEDVSFKTATIAGNMLKIVGENSRLRARMKLQAVKRQIAELEKAIEKLEA